MCSQVEIQHQFMIQTKCEKTKQNKTMIKTMKICAVPNEKQSASLLLCDKQVNPNSCLYIPTNLQFKDKSNIFACTQDLADL